MPAKGIAPQTVTTPRTTSTQLAPQGDPPPVPQAPSEGQKQAPPLPPPYPGWPGPPSMPRP
jgi:hypothetical protein